MQTSISAWLKKPASVKEPPPVKLPVKPTAFTTTHDSTPVTPPTPLNGTTKQQEEEPPSPPKPIEVSNEASNTTIPTFLPDKRPLIPNIRLEPCTTSTISAFTRLNTLLLPIPYPARFYNEILASEIDSSITLLAIWHDNTASTNTTGRVIGGIRCRLLGPDGHKMLYISTLCVLSPYRSYGAATHLLQTVLRTAIEKYGVREVGAHVWEASAEAREWYAKRGFREEKREVGYYRRLKPQDAFVLKREVGPRDLLGL